MIHDRFNARLCTNHTMHTLYVMGDKCMKRAKIRQIAISIILVFCIIMSLGCNNAKLPISDSSDGQSLKTPDSLVKIEPITVEAEDQTMVGNLSVAKSTKGYSGTGYVEGFKEENDILTFRVSIETTAFYDLIFTTCAQDHKVNYVLVDGVNVGDLTTDSKFFADSAVKRVYLAEGEHEIGVQPSWGWISLDKLKCVQSEALDSDIFKVKAKLSNPNATENTKRLMSYLIDIYGKQMLTGQYCDTGSIGTECAAIYSETGDYPAVLGLDFTSYSPASVAHGTIGTATTFAKAYGEKGGIVTFCWHWTLPDKYCTAEWYSSFYTKSCSFKLKKALSGEDPEGYQALLDGIDAIAQQILILQESDIPILWRPLHEASGAWFWWGAAGPEAYKELYILMYDKLTNEYGCNNLIWVWNAQGKAWYPGDEYVDIIGIDIYPGEHVYSSQIDKFLEYSGYSNERKIVVLSENGCLFDPDLAVRDGAMWGFYATWGGEFVLKSPKFARYSETYTDIEMLNKVYSSEYMITRSELPDMRTYPIRDDFE